MTGKEGQSNETQAAKGALGSGEQKNARLLDLKIKKEQRGPNSREKWTGSRCEKTEGRETQNRAKKTKGSENKCSGDAARADNPHREGKLESNEGRWGVFHPPTLGKNDQKMEAPLSRFLLLEMLFDTRVAFLNLPSILDLFLNLATVLSWGHRKC